MDVNQDDQDDPHVLKVEYLCKWKDLPYGDSTWERQEDITPEFQPEIDSLLDRNNSDRIPHRSAANALRSSRYYSTLTVSLNDRPEFKKFSVQPKWITGGTLRDYQLLGSYLF